MALSGFNSAANRVSRLVSELVVGYRPARMVADFVAPVVPTMGTEFLRGDRAATIAAGDVETMIGAPRHVIAPRQEKVALSFSLRSAQVLESALYQKLSAPELEASTIRRRIEAEILDTIYLKREVAASTLFFTSGNYGSGFTAAAAAAWSGATLAQIKADFEAGALALSAFPRESLGVLIGLAAWSGLMANSALLAHFSPTTPNATSEQMLAAFFGVKEVRVGRAKNGSANVWGNSACIFPIPETLPGDGDPVRSDIFGLTFRSLALGSGFEVPIIEEPAYGIAGGGTIVAGEMYEAIVAAGASNGYLITGC